MGNAKKRNVTIFSFRIFLFAAWNVCKLFSLLARWKSKVSECAQTIARAQCLPAALHLHALLVLLILKKRENVCPIFLCLQFSLSQIFVFLSHLPRHLRKVPLCSCALLHKENEQQEDWECEVHGGWRLAGGCSQSFTRCDDKRLVDEGNERANFNMNKCLPWYLSKSSCHQNRCHYQITAMHCLIHVFIHRYPHFYTDLKVKAREIVCWASTIRMWRSKSCPIEF